MAIRSAAFTAVAFVIFSYPLGAWFATPSSPPEQQDVIVPPSPPRPPTSGRTSEQSHPSPVARPIHQLAEGTTLEIRVREDLGRKQSGEIFEGFLDRDLAVDGQAVLRRGNRFRGRVLEAVPPGGSYSQQVSVVLTDLLTDRNWQPIRTGSVVLQFSEERERSGWLDALRIGAEIGPALNSPGCSRRRPLANIAELGGIFSENPHRQSPEDGRLLTFRLTEAVEVTPGKFF